MKIICVENRQAIAINPPSRIIKEKFVKPIFVSPFLIFLIFWVKDERIRIRFYYFRLLLENSRQLLSSQPNTAFFHFSVSFLPFFQISFSVFLWTPELSFVFIQTLCFFSVLCLYFEHCVLNFYFRCMWNSGCTAERSRFFVCRALCVLSRKVIVSN